jgi:MscS family membrane protein
MVMPEFLTKVYFDNTLYQYLIFLICVSASIIIGKILYWIIQKYVKKYTQKTKNRFDDILVEMSEKPAILYIILLGINIGWKFLSFPNYPKIPIYYGHLIYLAVVFVSAWFISRLLRKFLDTYIKPLAEKTKTDLDDAILPILSKLINIIVFFIAIIMVLQHFGQEIGPILAGLGLGGLAFALAAKDLLSNLFGSITILLDKPFTIGQRIKINDQEGFVEEISLRTTKIKTFEGRILYVPNSKFTDGIVENISKEPARRVKMNIGLTYDTNSKELKKAKEIMKKILIKNKDIDPKKILIYFTEFGAYSKNILVIYWITNKEKIFEVQDEVNMRIMEEFDKARLNMAFPTQTIEIKNSKKN